MTRATSRSKEPSVAPAKPDPQAARTLVFAVALGSALALALLKFGNPIILDRLIDPPKEFWEFMFQPWPVRWGYLFLLVSVVLGIPALRWNPAIPKWAIILPLAWFGWQVAAASNSIAPALTRVTLIHFAACVGCFLLGLLGMGGLKRTGVFWGPVLIAFAYVLWRGIEQHYGGLEATRKMFYQQPDWQQYPAEYIRRIQGNRIFSTLVYPNALAGALLLLTPPLLVSAWKISGRLTMVTRGVLIGLLGYSAVGCLYWSGSKSGWLVGMVLVLALLLRQRLSQRLKVAIVLGLIAVGLAGFFLKYAGYFQRGAPSVSARFDYWRAGLQTAWQRPAFGTGPGSFSAAYREVKRPESEMAQLVHNDYLEQASDSGWVGFLLYASFIVGSIGALGRTIWRQDNPESFAVWLGLLGWSLQSFVEFLLYIPALAWTAFMFLGWLWSRTTTGDASGQKLVPRSEPRAH